MNANNEEPRWSFYPTWIILTSLCVPVAYFIDLVILKAIVRYAGDYIHVNGVRHITEDYLYMFIFIPLVGLMTGVIQYGLLRRYLPRIGWWAPATFAGWLVGVLLPVMPLEFLRRDGSLGPDMALLLMGLTIGFGQWLLLRRLVPHASWWIGANVAGWGLLALLTPGNAFNQFVLFTLGFIPACCTAAMFAALMYWARPFRPIAV